MGRQKNTKRKVQLLISIAPVLNFESKQYNTQLASPYYIT